MFFYHLPEVQQSDQRLQLKHLHYYITHIVIYKIGGVTESGIPCLSQNGKSLCVISWKKENMLSDRKWKHFHVLSGHYIKWFRSDTKWNFFGTPCHSMETCIGCARLTGRTRVTLGRTSELIFPVARQSILLR